MASTRIDCLLPIRATLFSVYYVCSISTVVPSLALGVPVTIPAQLINQESLKSDPKNLKT